MDKEDIKKLREKLGLNKSEFAALVYVNYHTIGKWENGLSIPRPSPAARLKELWLQEFKSVYLPEVRETKTA